MSRLNRRHLLQAALAVTAPAAVAQTGFPSRPIKFIVPYPPGGATDLVGRLLAARLQESWGQNVVVENKAGASGMIGSEMVARSAPDGHTVLVGITTHIQNSAIFAKVPYDPLKDFEPVSQICLSYLVLVVKPEFPANNLKEFVALVKANPGKYNYASTGNGAGTHMAFAEFNARLGLDMVHVPYKGGPEAIQAVLKGDTCCIMNQVQTVLSHYKAGKVRLLGVTTAAPVAAVKEVPTIASSGLPGTQGFDSSIWFAIFAPKGTDARIVDKLNAAVKVVLEQREVQAHFEAQGNAVRIESPDQFRKTVRDNRVKWAEVARSANITLD